MLLDQLLNPDPAALAAFLNLHLQGRTGLLQVACEAEITYHGRAMSLAQAGEYLLLVKPDGSVQVHGPRGVKPVNWQPGTDSLHAAVEDGICVLTARRSRPDEVLRVLFVTPGVAQALGVRAEGEFLLDGTEAQLQEVLARAPHLIEEGLTVLDRELLVGVGGIDLYARDAAGRYVIVELKRGRAGQEAVHQLGRYVDAVRTQLGGQVAVRGILAAPAVTAPARTRLHGAGLEFVEVRHLHLPQDEPLQAALFA